MVAPVGGFGRYKSNIGDAVGGLALANYQDEVKAASNALAAQSKMMAAKAGADATRFAGDKMAGATLFNGIVGGISSLAGGVIGGVGNAMRAGGGAGGVNAPTDAGMSWSDAFKVDLGGQFGSYTPPSSFSMPPPLNLSGWGR